MENNNEIEQLNKAEETDINNVSHLEKHIDNGEHHHHHSSRHHHHHHRHKDERHKSRNYPLIVIIALTAVIIVIGIIILLPEKKNNGGSVNNIVDTIGESTLTCSVEETYSLVNDGVKKYLTYDLLDSKYSNIKPSQFVTDGYVGDEKRVTITFGISKGSVNVYSLVYTTDSSYNNLTRVYLPGNSTSYTFEYLYTNTTYYYQLEAYTDNGTLTKRGNFMTLDTPRILNIDGVYNTRDIGNKVTRDGKVIKQGMIIRGTELDGAVEEEYLITNNGIIDLLNNLNIKFEMDLRVSNEKIKDALGAGVIHKVYGFSGYQAIFTQTGKDVVKEVFTDFTKQENFPMYLHCTYGCDRTGTVCYLLEALLGVSELDCLRDYGLSNLTTENILAVREGLKEYDGETLQEQVTSYLISCGISLNDINKIKNLLLV